MPHFSGCRVIVGYGDGRAATEDEDSDLHLGEGELLLSYWDEQGAVVLIGAEVEPGRFELTARSRPRRCTLRREDSRTFTGSWVQGQDCGTLRVELPAGAAAGKEADSKSRPTRSEPKASEGGPLHSQEADSKSRPTRSEPKASEGGPLHSQETDSKSRPTRSEPKASEGVPLPGSEER